MKEMTADDFSNVIYGRSCHHLIFLIGGGDLVPPRYFLFTLSFVQVQLCPRLQRSSADRNYCLSPMICEILSPCKHILSAHRVFIFRIRIFNEYCAYGISLYNCMEKTL